MGSDKNSARCASSSRSSVCTDLIGFSLEECRDRMMCAEQKSVVKFYNSTLQDMLGPPDRLTSISVLMRLLRGLVLEHPCLSLLL